MRMVKTRTLPRATMKRRAFGPTGEQVPVIGQGTWQVRDTRHATQAIRRGMELGMLHIDTAELYEARSGSESMLGGLLSELDASGKALRDKVFLASKVRPPNDSAKGVVSSCKDSLVCLGTDRIDLYYHHWRGEVPMEETLRAIAGLVDAGWVRHIGVSNYDVADLEEAESILGKRKLAANQVLYHLEDRGCESEVMAWCRAHHLALVAYSTFGAGAWIRDAGRRKLLEGIASETGHTPRQVALAFLTRHDHVFAIPKAETVAHVEDNAGSDFDLSRQHIEAIDVAFQIKPGLRSI